VRAALWNCATTRLDKISEKTAGRARAPRRALHVAHECLTHADARRGKKCASFTASFLKLLHRSRVIYTRHEKTAALCAFFTSRHPALHRSRALARLVRINEFPAQSRAPLIFAELIFVSLTDDGAATVMVIDKGKAFARINTLSGAVADRAVRQHRAGISLARARSLKPADAGDSVCSLNDTSK